MENQTTKKQKPAPVYCDKHPDRPAHDKGRRMCSMCKARWREKQTTDDPQRQCRKKGCRRVRASHELCKRHWMYHRRTHGGFPALGIAKAGACEDCSARSHYYVDENKLMLLVVHDRTCPEITAEERVHGQFAKLTEVYGVVEAAEFDRVHLNGVAR